MVLKFLRCRESGWKIGVVWTLLLLIVSFWIREPGWNVLIAWVVFTHGAYLLRCWRILKRKESILINREWVQLQKSIELILQDLENDLLRSQAASISAAQSKSQSISMTRSDFQSLVDATESLSVQLLELGRLTSEYSTNSKLRMPLRGTFSILRKLSAKLALLSQRT